MRKFVTCELIHVFFCWGPGSYQYYSVVLQSQSGFCGPWNVMWLLVFVEYRLYSVGCYICNLLLELHLFLCMMLWFLFFSAWDDFGFVHIAVIHLKLSTTWLLYDMLWWGWYGYMTTFSLLVIVYDPQDVTCYIKPDLTHMSKVLPWQRSIHKGLWWRLRYKLNLQYDKTED